MMRIDAGAARDRALVAIDADDGSAVSDRGGHRGQVGSWSASDVEHHVAWAQVQRAEIWVAAAAGCPVVLMHHRGDPATMQDDPRYDRPVVLEVYDWLEARIAAAEAAGIQRGRIIVDPGFGFGKTVRHNLELMNGLAMLHGLGCALMVGASRKRTIGALAGEAPPDRRLAGRRGLGIRGGGTGVVRREREAEPPAGSSIRGSRSWLDSRAPRRPRPRSRRAGPRGRCDRVSRRSQASASAPHPRC